jgi:prepilin-type N-terminal cleavage/methylation domain-containing protein
MNMMLKKRLASSRGRKGFTLVEVIVVLVILAILAAIAIPALTGYIDKAGDKKYIMAARNGYNAARAVVNEAYANRELSSSYAVGIIEDGEGSVWHATPTKRWSLSLLSYFANNPTTNSLNWTFEFQDATNALLGQENVGKWDINFIGSPTSTALDADGYIYVFAPEGISGSNPIIVVTYHLKHVDASGSYNNFEQVINNEDYYDSEAGFEVYHQFFWKG